MSEEIEELGVLREQLSSVKGKVENYSTDISEMISSIKRFIEDNSNHYEEADKEKKPVQQRIQDLVEQLESFKTEYETFYYENRESLKNFSNNQEENVELLSGVKSEIMLILESFTNSTQSNQYDELYAYLQTEKTKTDNSLDGVYQNITATIDSIDTKASERLELQEQQEVGGGTDEKASSKDTKLMDAYTSYGIGTKNLQDAREAINEVVKGKDTQENQLNPNQEQGDRE